MKRTTIFVPEDIERDLQHYAGRDGRPAAALVREALATYIAHRREGHSLPSFAGQFASASRRHRREPRVTALQEARAASRQPITGRPVAKDARARESAPGSSAPLMPLLVDTGILYALADRSDAWHQRTITYLKSTRLALVAPVTILAEVAYLLRERLGSQSERAFAESIARAELAVEDIKRTDWIRIERLMGDYPEIGLVDASVVAVGERMKARVLATTDRRHFGAVRPAHIPAFTLVP